MSLPVFLVDEIQTPSTHLTGAEGRHAVTVKRLRIGEEVELVDGAGTRATGRITAIHGKDQLDADIVEVQHEPPKSPKVSIIQALPKAERSELAVDLATQVGADEIVPWQADRCIAKWEGAKATKGQAKWEAAGMQAAKQSRRSHLPIIGEVIDTGALVTAIKADQHSDETVNLVLHEEASTKLSTVSFNNVSQVRLIIGPEGGIGHDELERLVNAGALPVLLGDEVLRTASAGAVATTVINVLTSRW